MTIEHESSLTDHRFAPSEVSRMISRFHLSPYGNTAVHHVYELATEGNHAWQISCLERTHPDEWRLLGVSCVTKNPSSHSLDWLLMRLNAQLGSDPRPKLKASKFRGYDKCAIWWIMQVKYIIVLIHELVSPRLSTSIYISLHLNSYSDSQKCKQTNYRRKRSDIKSTEVSFFLSRHRAYWVFKWPRSWWVEMFSSMS